MAAKYEQVPLKVVGGATFGRYPKISTENTYNMIISDNALVIYPGYVEANTIVEAGEARGVFKSTRHNIIVMVVDDSFFVIENDLNYEFRGHLSTFSGFVYISENENDQIAVVDNSFIYIYHTDTFVFERITLSVEDNFSPGYIDYQDGYFIAADISSNQWRLSLPNDGRYWPRIQDGVSFVGNFQTKPDIVQATVQFNRQLFIMADTGTEIWHDVGNTLFPYQRENAISIDLGVLSRASIAVGFGYLVWLANNEAAGPTIVWSTGGTPQSISTDGIDLFLAQLTHPEDSSAFLFQEAGHIYYQITFPTDNQSLVYDFESHLFTTVTDADLNYHIAKKSVFFNNKNYFISYIDGKLYQFGTQFTTYNGRTVPRFRICPPIRLDDSRRFRVRRIILTMEQGVCYVPQKIGLSMSKNGGESFGTIYEKELNPLGDYKNRMIIWNLGDANDLTIKLQFWSGNAVNPPGNPTEPPILTPLPPNVNNIERFVVLNAIVEVGGSIL